jgi:hypothetical protein
MVNFTPLQLSYDPSSKVVALTQVTPAKLHPSNEDGALFGPAGP